MTFTLGKEEYGADINKVRKIIRLVEITFMQKKEVVLLRGETTGITRLKNIMSLSDDNKCEEGKIVPIAIIAAGTRKVGIVEDELMDQEEVVIKLVHEPLVEIPGLGGVSIMDRDHTILVLDSLELVNVTESRVAAALAK